MKIYNIPAFINCINIFIDFGDKSFICLLLSPKINKLFIHPNIFNVFFSRLSNASSQWLIAVSNQLKIILQLKPFNVAL